MKKKNHVYGIIGLVGLFLVGGMLGYTLNGSSHLRNASMSKSQCDQIAESIVYAARNGANADKIAELNKLYSENCVDRNFVEAKPQPQPKVETKKLPEQTCEAVEELLKESLNDENSMNAWDHQRNAQTYQRLVDKGCEKNKEKYWNLAQREFDIAKALDVDHELERNVNNVSSATTCEKIEVALLDRINCRYDSYCSESEHIDNAQIYANLSERGCPENSNKYKELAKQELEIARALTDDSLENEPKVTEMVETYKRLQMQAEAIRMIEKAKKLTNPAIDFIIQLEKIIEE